MQTSAVTKEWNARADLPAHVARMLDNFPDNLHPMAQFVAATAALNNESKVRELGLLVLCVLRIFDISEISLPSVNEALNLDLDTEFRNQFIDFFI